MEKTVREARENNKSSGNDVKRLSKRLTNILALAIAVPYFLLDAIFAAVAIPLAKWIAGHWAFARIHGWVLSLKPYPTLLLFIVPLIVLEPVKPVAALLVASHHAALGLSALVIAEILKLVFIERLFSVSRTKLLSIPGFRLGLRKIFVREKLAAVARGLAARAALEPDRAMCSKAHDAASAPLDRARGTGPLDSGQGRRTAGTRIDQGIAGANRAQSSGAGAPVKRSAVHSSIACVLACAALPWPIFGIDSSCSLLPALHSRLA